MADWSDMSEFKPVIEIYWKKIYSYNEYDTSICSRRTCPESRVPPVILHRLCRVPAARSLSTFPSLRGLVAGCERPSRVDPVGVREGRGTHVVGVPVGAPVRVEREVERVDDPVL